MADHGADLWEVLRQVEDPELGIDIVVLGMVEKIDTTEGGEVTVVMRHSFVGCMAVPLIHDAVVSAVRDHLGQEPTLTMGERWMTSHVTAEGTRQLAELGIAVDRPGSELACPYCGSSEVSMDSPIGSAPCRAAFACSACRTPFDAMRSADVRLLRIGATRG